MWQRNMDLGFLFEKGLYCYYLGAGNYLLSCRIITNENMFAKEGLSKENMLMITMLLRKSERLGIGVMFFCFIFVWWRTVRRGRWTVAQGYNRRKKWPDKFSGFGVLRFVLKLRFRDFCGQAVLFGVSWNLR